MGDEVTILLAEHEPGVAEMSARYLRRDGRQVRLVTAPEAALAELAGGRDAAAVLDLTMPGLDPRHVRRALRTPAVLLSAGPKAHRPRGLSAPAGPGGPRRWLSRPFSPRQLVTLVRDVLTPPAPRPDRRPAVSGLCGPTLCGPTLCGPTLCGPTLCGPTLCGPTLTAGEAAVLAAMTDHPGRVLSRRQLLAAAGHDRAGDRAADVYIAQLRAKLGGQVVIRTVRGTGYVIDS
jgi:DNA-binding response OmpR family regulator